MAMLLYLVGFDLFALHVCIMSNADTSLSTCRYLPTLGNAMERPENYIELSMSIFYTLQVHPHLHLAPCLLRNTL